MQTGKDNRAAFDEQFAIQLQEGPPGDIEKVVQDFLLLEIADVADAVADELGLDEETKNRALEITTLYSELEIVAAEIVITRLSNLDESSLIDVEGMLNSVAKELELDIKVIDKVLQLIDITKHNKKVIFAADTIVVRLVEIKISVNSHKNIS